MGQQPTKEERGSNSNGAKELSAEEQENLRRINADLPKLIQLQQHAESFVQSLSPQEKGVMLRRKGLKKLPTPLFALNNITLLDLSFNRLRALPSELAQLQQLIHLKFKFESGYPEDEVNVVTKFPQLQFLDISWNNMPSVRFLGGLSSSVTHLDIHHNWQLSEVPDISHLKALTYFNASETFIKTLPHLDMLPLKNLLASYTIGLKQLPRLPATLTSLSAAEKVEAIGVDLSHCVNLTFLNLKSNMIKNIEELDGLRGLTSLNYLALGPSQFQGFPDIVSSFTSLNTLEYGGMKNLKELPNSLSALARLQKLVLRWNELSVFPEVLLQLTNLTDLDMAGNGLLELPPTISALSKLQAFNLSYNKLKTVPRELGFLEALRFLHIDENPIEDAALYDLAKKGDTSSVVHYIKTGEVQPPVAVPPPANPKHTQNIPVRENTPPAALLAIPEGATRLSREQLVDKIRGIIFGNALGDAIGLATEFLNKEQSSFIYGRSALNFNDFDYPRDRHRGRWLTGDWTDDTDQLILILENIIEGNGKADLSTFALTLVKWAFAGFSELGDDGGMGIGQTVGQVLNHKKFLSDPHLAASEVWEKTGRKVAANGAVMRTGVLGIPNFNDITKVTENTLEFCKVTHADPRCQASCVAVTTAIALMLQGEDNVAEIIRQAEERAQLYVTDETHKTELTQHMHAHVRDLELSDRPKIGYTYKTMGSGIYALRENDFEKAMMMVTWEAGDADTNAAVAGAMLGCKLGFAALPERWVNGLAHKDWLHRKVNTLLDLMGL